MTEKLHKSVSDLGVAAYALMHGYTVIGKKSKDIYFECSPQEMERFDQLLLEYQPPNDFYTFDSCLMFLKKINEVSHKEDVNHKCVSDLGVAAYLLMNEYKSTRIGLKVVGKKGKNIYFSHPAGVEDTFRRMCYEYLTSQFQTYDSALMGLKKIGEYSPKF